MEGSRVFLVFVCVRARARARTFVFMKSPSRSSCTRNRSQIDFVFARRVTWPVFFNTYIQPALVGEEPTACSSLRSDRLAKLRRLFSTVNAFPTDWSNSMPK